MLNNGSACLIPDMNNTCYVMWSKQHEQCAFPPFLILCIGVNIWYIYVVFGIVKQFSIKLRDI